ncbi:MAG: hypothetical protein AB7W37_04980 [Syntrophobacteraceae bacterium]|jgi:CHASE1-domain containing sensor protein
MKKLKSLFRQTEFHALIFCIALGLLNWPFLGALRSRRLEVVALCLFLFWLVLIVLLLLISRCIEEDDRGCSGESRKDKT